VFDVIVFVRMDNREVGGDCVMGTSTRRRTFSGWPNKGTRDGRDMQQPRGRLKCVHFVQNP